MRQHAALGEGSKAFEVDQKTGRRSTSSLIVKVALVDQSSTDVFAGALDPHFQRFIKGTFCDRLRVQVPERFRQSHDDGVRIVAASVDAIEAGDARHQKVLPVVFNRKREQTRNWKLSVKPSQAIGLVHQPDALGYRSGLEEYGRAARPCNPEDGCLRASNIYPLEIAAFHE